ERRPHLLRPRVGRRDHERRHRQDPEHAAAQRRRAGDGDAHRVVHGGAAAAQHALQDARRGEAHGHPRAGRRWRGPHRRVRRVGGGGEPRGVGHRGVRGGRDGVTRDRARGAGPMRLHDTARGEVVPFTPGRVVTMYTCGITPYDATHIGHAATYLTYDVLQRRLRDRGHETRCARNVTDVDDDILRKARELGVHYLDLAAAETARFQDDMRALGLLPAWSEPRATSAIPDIRGFIGMVLDRGYAYQSGGA